MDDQKLIEEINKLHYRGFLEIAISPDDKDITDLFGSFRWKAKASNR